MLFDFRVSTAARILHYMVLAYSPMPCLLSILIGTSNTLLVSIPSSTLDILVAFCSLFGNILLYEAESCVLSLNVCPFPICMPPPQLSKWWLSPPTLHDHNFFLFTFAAFVYSTHRHCYKFMTFVRNSANLLFLLTSLNKCAARMLRFAWYLRLFFN